jgi:hypothetical protein
MNSRGSYVDGSHATNANNTQLDKHRRPRQRATPAPAALGHRGTDRNGRYLSPAVHENDQAQIRANGVLRLLSKPEALLHGRAIAGLFVGHIGRRAAHATGQRSGF